MLNFRKICRVMFLAAFACTLAGSAMAQEWCGDVMCPKGQFCQDGACVSNSLKNASFVADFSKTNGKAAQKAEDQAKTAGAGTNDEQSASSVTGCSSNYGLFSGLIETGRKIFNGLRDLIYVVAGFGIIGVAVGGFFGNLNWKWLGAIVIALVVIATTGEIINMITGCDKFTAAMISDTLK